MLWGWIETTPVEPSSPFINFIQRTPPPASRRPTPLPLADQPNITIASKPYLHPSKTFGVKYPDGWQMDEAEDAVLFTAPDDTAQWSITFRRPSSASPDLATLARTYSQTGWGDLAAFKVESTQIKDGVSFRFEQLSLPEKDKLTMFGQTTAQRSGGMIFFQTLLVRADLQTRYVSLFQSLTGSLMLNPPK